MSVYELKKGKKPIRAHQRSIKLELLFLFSRRGRLDMATVVVAALGFFVCVSLNERKWGGGIVGPDRREIEKIKH